MTALKSPAPGTQPGAMANKQFEPTVPDIVARLAAVPTTMTERPQWIVHHDKQPYSPHSGGRASVRDPDTWGTFADACTALTRGNWQGVGYVFTEDDALTGIDLDGCRDPETGTLEPWAEAILSTCGSYAETSPSGRGVHIIGTGIIPGTRNRRGPVELYDRGRYFTVTGEALTNAGINNIQDTIDRLYREHLEPEPQPRHFPASRNGLAPESADEDVLTWARQARNGGKFTRLWDGDTEEHAGDHSAADQALCNILAYWTRDPEQIDRLFRRSGLYREKWDRVHHANGQTYGQRTIDEALSWVTDWYHSPAKTHQNGHSAPEDTAPVPEATPVEINAVRDDDSADADLLQRLEEAEARIAQLEARNRELEAMHSQFFKVQRNKRLGASRPVALAVVSEVAAAASRGKASEDGWVRVYLGGPAEDVDMETGEILDPEPGNYRDWYVSSAISDKAGCHPNTASKHIARLHEWGVIEKRVTREWNERQGWVSALNVRLLQPAVETLDQLATIDPGAPQHGDGTRIQCKHNAGVIVERITSCAECGERLDYKRREVPPKQEAENLNHHGCDSEDTPPTVGYVPRDHTDSVSEPQPHHDGDSAAERDTRDPSGNQNHHHGSSPSRRANAAPGAVLSARMEFRDDPAVSRAVLAERYRR